MYSCIPHMCFLHVHVNHVPTCIRNGYMPHNAHINEYTAFCILVLEWRDQQTLGSVLQVKQDATNREKLKFEGMRSDEFELFLRVCSCTSSLVQYMYYRIRLSKRPLY